MAEDLTDAINTEIVNKAKDVLRNPQGLGSLVYSIHLRDLFAMAALAGLLADPNSSGSKENFSESSYEYADHMLKERSK